MIGVLAVMLQGRAVIDYHLLQALTYVATVSALAIASYRKQSFRPAIRMGR